MTPYTWNGVECVRVGAIKQGRCYGCIFQGEDFDNCPHTDPSTAVECEVYSGNNNDTIFIHNTPAAMAEYVAKKLGAPDENEDTS